MHPCSNLNSSSLVFQEHAVKSAVTHPCPNHNFVRVPGAFANQRIHAQTIHPFVFQEHMRTSASMPKVGIPFVFQEHTLTRASMLKPYVLSCSKSIRSPEHLWANHNSVSVPRAYGHRSIYGQTIIPLVFQERTLTRAFMPEP